jgi:GH15 family glucan-1,4-alpha-glucosidase
LTSLFQKSIRVIRDGQAPSGAYIASPNFPTYHYCWLRDSSFIAHAMDTAGEYASSAAFFGWTGKTITKYSHKIEKLRCYLEHGQPISKDDVLHTRYTLDGEEVTVDESWGNFQIDGYGTWLWALSEHVKRSGNVNLVRELNSPIKVTLQYLELVWKLPNYDCWEEYPEHVHPYSLATVFSGFTCMSQLAGMGHIDLDEHKYARLAAEVKEFIQQHAVFDGRLVKHISMNGNSANIQHQPSNSIDSSLIGIAVPYGVFPSDDPRIQATIHAIEADLHRPGGGVYRYRDDVYYGGGEWLLLTAWLGWYYARAGDIDRATRLMQWIEAQADDDGHLAEQVNNHLLAPEHYQPWLQKWGPVAKPLLWSHAMYIILVNAIQKAES